MFSFKIVDQVPGDSLAKRNVIVPTKCLVILEQESVLMENVRLVMKVPLV